MTSQTLCQIVALVGLVVTGLAGFGSYYFGNLDQAEGQRKSDEIQRQLGSQLKRMEDNLNSKAELIYQAIVKGKDI
jgi:hypothetical protein